MKKMGKVTESIILAIHSVAARDWKGYMGRDEGNCKIEKKNSPWSSC